MDALNSKPAGPTMKTALIAEVEAARGAVLETIGQYQELISLPCADVAKLTGIRLQLAQQRMVHGSIVERVAEHLKGKNPTAELAIRSIQPEHAGLLHRTLAHTQKWTSAAVESDWPEYCKETAEMLRRWTERVGVEERILREMLERDVA